MNAIPSNTRHPYYSADSKTSFELALGICAWTMLFAWGIAFALLLVSGESIDVLELMIIAVVTAFMALPALVILFIAIAIFKRMRQYPVKGTWQIAVVCIIVSIGYATIVDLIFWITDNSRKGLWVFAVTTGILVCSSFLSMLCSRKAIFNFSCMLRQAERKYKFYTRPVSKGRQ